MSISKRLFGDETLGELVAWLLVLLAFAYPYPACLSILLKVSSTPINIAARAVYVALSLYIIIVSSFKKDLKIPIAGLSLLFFWFIYTIRIIIDLEIFHIETFHTKLDIYSFGLGNIFLPVIAILLAFKYSNLSDFFTKTLYLLIGANFLIINIFIDQHNGLDASAFLERAYLVSPITGGNVVNPISFSLYGGYGVIIGLLGLLIYSNKLSKIKLIACILSIIIGLPNLILGASRGPTIIVALAITLIFAVHLSRTTFTFRYNIRLVFCLFLTAFIYSHFIAPKINAEDFAIVGRLDTLAQGKQANDREYLYQEAFDMFLASPALGNQIVLETTKSYPHNLFLEILMSLGLLGALLYFIITVNMIKCYVFFKKYDDYYPTIMATLFVAMGLSFTSGCLYQNIEFWNLLAALLASASKLRSTV
jgi:hypothetical protein